MHMYTRIVIFAFSFGFFLGVIQCDKFSCPCLNNGICETFRIDPFTPKCKCPKGYYGKNCQYIDECHHNPCQNLGNCSRAGDGFKCFCPSGTTGKRCECFDGIWSPNCQNQDPNRDPCALQNRTCQNGGVCYRIDNKLTEIKCTCPNGFNGEFCELRNPCELYPNYCGYYQNSGICRRLSDTEAECTCFKDFYGDHCEFEDACLQNPCIHGGICRNEGSGFECQCPQYHYGKTCEIIVVQQQPLASRLSRILEGEIGRENFLIPSTSDLGDKVNFRSIFSEQQIENLAENSYFEWFLGDGTSRIINVSEILKHNRNRKRHTDDDGVTIQHVFNHSYNDSGIFFIQVYSVADEQKTLAKSLLADGETRVLKSICFPRVRIHNVGHANESTPIPEYTQKQSVMAWAIFYFVCKPPKNFHIVNTHQRNFQWKLFTEVGNTPIQIQKIPVQVSPELSIEKHEQSIVNLRPWNLPYGLYRLEVSATVAFNEDLHFLKSKKFISKHISRMSDQDVGFFRIVPTSPQALILGGDYRIVNSNGSVILVGTESMDPDFHSAENHKLTYSWVCSNEKRPGVTCGLRTDSLNWRMPTLVFKAGMLQPKENYTFTLTVSSDKSKLGRNHFVLTNSTKQIVFVSLDAMNDYTITCVENCGRKVIAEKKTVIKCNCETCSSTDSHTIRWKLSPELDQEKWVTKTSFISGLPGVELFILIRANVLQEYTNKNTTFTLFCHDGNFTRAAYDFQVHQHPIPASSLERSDGIGHCKISPTTGISMETKFIIDCDVFISESASPVFYSVYAHIHNGNLMKYPNPKGFLLHHEIVGTQSGPESNQLFFELILPVGDPSNDFTLDMSVEISDSFSSSVNVSFNVQPKVKPPNNITKTVLDSISEMSYFSEAGHDTILNLLFASNRAGLFRLILAVFHQISINQNLFSINEEQKIKEIILIALNMTAVYNNEELFQTSNVLNIRDLEQMASVIYAILVQNPNSLSNRSYIISTDLVVLMGYQLEMNLRPLEKKDFDLRIVTDNYIDSLYFPLIKTVMESTVILINATQKKQKAILSGIKLVQSENIPLEHDVRQKDAVPRNYFLSELPTHEDFTFTFVESDRAENISIGLKQIIRMSKILMETLRRLGNSIGSGLYFLEEPIQFDFEELLSLYVGMFQIEYIPGMRVPQNASNSSLFHNNFLRLSKTPINMTNCGEEFLQLFVIVSVFNPYIDERELNHIETPLFQVELFEDSTMTTVNHLVTEESPHEIQLEYLESRNLHVRIVDKFNQDVNSKNGFIINADLSNLTSEDIIVHHFTLPPASKFYVLLENMKELDILMVLKHNDRPTCADFKGHTNENIVYTNNESVRKFIYEFNTKDSPKNELLDYYAAFSATRESINTSIVSIVNNKIEVGLSFARLRCISRRHIIQSKWKEDCVIVATMSNHKDLICRCRHLSFFSGSLRESGHSIQTFQTIELFPEPYETILIPLVVGICLVLYLILLPIIIWRDRYNQVILPKLYVLADVNRIREETFYLLTLETGNNFMGGTSANVGCQIYGSKGRSKPYLLSDANMDSTRQNCTADFLISSEKYLGQLEKLRIWHDNSGHNPGWYCRKVVIRDIKTDEIWFFFFQIWLTVRDTTHNTSLISEIASASEQEIAEHFNGKVFRIKKYWHQFREHHVWLSGLTCPPTSTYSRAERLSCAMSVLCSYMLTLVLLYYKSAENKNTMVEFGDIELDHDFVLLNGTIAAFLGLYICLTLVNSFRRIRRKRIPALVVLANTNPFQNKRKQRFHNSIENSGTRVKTESKELDPDEKPSYSKLDEDMLEPNLVRIKSYSETGKEETRYELFRIPSTNMIETEAWISETMKEARSEGQDSFVQVVVQPYNARKKHESPYNLKIMQDFGLTGELVNLNDENPLMFDYKPKPRQLPLIPKDESRYKSFDSDEKCVRLLSLATESAQEEIQKNLVKSLKERTEGNESAYEPINENDYGKYAEKDEKFQVILGEVEDEYEFGRCLPAKFVYISWAICVSIIIVTSTLTIIIGLEFSYRRSVFWAGSLVLAFLESCLIFQPLKVLVAYLFIIRQIRKKSRKSDNELYILERLKVFWAEKKENIKLWPLNYKLYINQNTILPLAGSHIFHWKMQSRRKWMMRRGLLDLLVFSVFMIILIYTMTRTRDDNHFQSTQNMKDVLHISIDQKILHKRSFDNIREEEEFYEYMEHVLIPAIYMETNFNGDPLVQNVDNSVVWLQNRQSFLLGVPRIRQLRVKNESNCDHVKKWHQHTKEHVCSEEFDDSLFYSNKDTDSYSEGWKPVEKGEERDFSPTNDLWSFRTEEQTGSFGRSGFMSTYSGEGYIATLGRTPEQSLGVIRHIRRTQWIDTRTRFVILEFNTYNPNVDLFNLVELMLERSPIQCIVQEPFVVTTRFVDFPLQSPLALSFALCVLYMMFTSFRPLIDHFFQRRRRSFLNWTLVLDALSSIIGLAICINYVILWNQVKHKMAILRESPVNEYVSMQYEEYRSRSQLHLYCVLMLLCLCKLWSVLLLSNRRFFIIGFTLSITSPFMLGFLLMTLIIFVPFAIFLAINVNGSESFRSFFSSLMTLIYQTEVGNVLDYKVLNRESHILGGIIYFIFNIFVVFLFRNVFISALTLGLQGAKETSLQRPFRISYIGYIRLKLQLIIPSFIRKQFSGKQVVPLSEERADVMKKIVTKILTCHLNSLQVHRMNKMKKLTEKYLSDSTYYVVSKKEKMEDRKSRILKIEEDRLNSMRNLSIKFIKDKIKWDFEVEELEKYDNFNFEILKLKCKKLETKFKQFTPLLEKYLKKTESKKTFPNQKRFSSLSEPSTYRRLRSGSRSIMEGQTKVRMRKYLH